MALFFVVKEQQTYAVFVETGDTLEVDAEFTPFAPSPSVLEKLEGEALMRLAVRGGQGILKSLSSRPNKKLLIALLIENWGLVMSKAAEGEDMKDEKGKKDKNEPLWKLDKAALIQAAGKYKIEKLPNKEGKMVSIVNISMEAIIKAIRVFEPLQTTKDQASSASSVSVAVEEANDSDSDSDSV